MQMLLYGCAALFSLVWPSVAGDVSYVVLHKYGPDSLVRVSDDGRSSATIATGAGGYGLMVDKNGNYVVAAVSRLLRVTPFGAVSIIAVSPAGSQWLSVAVDPHGSYIVVDNQQHSIWRVSPEGQTVDRVATYPVDFHDEMEDTGVVVDTAGDYVVLEDNNFSAHLWRVSPTGSVTPVPLRGEKMRSGCAIVMGGDGSYFVASYRDDAIFHVSAAGEVTKVASVNGSPLGLARNPDTGELVVALRSDAALRKISADGSQVTEFSNAGYAGAVIIEPRR